MTGLGWLLNEFGNEFQNLEAIYSLCCSQNLATIQKLFYHLLLTIFPPTIHRMMSGWLENQQRSLYSGSKLKLISTLVFLPNPVAGGTSRYCRIRAVIKVGSVEGSRCQRNNEGEEGAVCPEPTESTDALVCVQSGNSSEHREQEHARSCTCPF